MNKETIIIVGGGIAGLVAARELADNFHIILIEANNRLGGRIYSHKEENFSTIIEGGSEFIHGHLKHTLKLLKEAQIDYVQVKGEMYRKERSEWKQRYEIIEGWDELLQQMKKIKQDMTMYDFLQKYFGAEGQADLRRQAIGYAEGFDVADVKKVSVKFLYEEWSHEEDAIFRIPAGYGALINYLKAECEKKGCRIIIGEPVKQIDWETNAVTAYTINGKKYKAERIIVTVPVSVLQRAMDKASINFTPPLHDYVNAAQKIGFGPVIKWILQFKEKFWKEDTGFIISDEIIPAWWTQLPNDAPLLTGWAGGSKVGRLGNETDDELLQKALLSLANIFSLHVNEISKKLAASKIFNWQKNEWSLGAYSYDMPGSIAAKKVLNKPVNNTIFFAGEGYSEGTSPGTVEAAIEHAKQTVLRVLSTK